MLSADGGNRTPDRRVTKPLLYQLSYISKLKPVESELEELSRGRLPFSDSNSYCHLL